MTLPTTYRLLAVLILGVIAAHKYATIRKPAGVPEYHQRIRESARSVPSRIDSWVGRDIPIPPQAIKVLDPNLMISRRFLNVETGVSAGFMFVHCSDAHDMAGHFPLRCFPARGWDVRSSSQRQWALDGLTVVGMEYEFVAGRPSNDGKPPPTMIVANCLMRPGKIFRDMDVMTQSIIGAGGQAIGAAQLQVSFDASVSREQRDAAVVTLMTGHRPVIDAVLAGAAPKQK
jgi:hypothetical protein